MSKIKGEVSNSKKKLANFNLLKSILSKLQINTDSENELIHQNVPRILISNLFLIRSHFLQKESKIKSHYETFISSHPEMFCRISQSSEKNTSHWVLVLDTLQACLQRYQLRFDGMCFSTNFAEFFQLNIL